MLGISSAHIEMNECGWDGCGEVFMAISSEPLRATDVGRQARARELRHTHWLAVHSPLAAQKIRIAEL